MKLRNKKTGKVQTLDFAVVSDDWEKDGVLARLDGHIFVFRSIKQLNEEYEDYEPKEPLIKDENVRALVRNWLMINKVDGAFRHNSNALRDGFGSLLIVRGGHFEKLKSEAFYTTEELCGEEEE